MNYDIIGDGNGRYDQLVALLYKLGYCYSSGAWLKTNHMVVFVGNLIDVWEKQVEIVNLEREMAQSNTVYYLLGNHEFNVIA